MNEKDKKLLAMGKVDVIQEEDWLLQVNCEECGWEGYEEGYDECPECDNAELEIESGIEGINCARCNWVFLAGDDYFEITTKGNPYEGERICKDCIVELEELGLEADM